MSTSVRIADRRAAIRSRRTNRRRANSCSWKPFGMARGGDGTPPRAHLESPHRLRRGRLDLQEHADFTGLRKRVLVFAQVFLGERVDMRVGAVLRDTFDGSANLQVAVRIFRIEDRERNPRTLFQSSR